MKKFTKFIAMAITGMVTFTNIMAATPVTKISFEAGETATWSVDKDNGASAAIVTTGVTDGVSALHINVPNRASDWETTTNFMITPPKGQVWSINKSDYLTATITNPNIFDIQIRVNIKDTDNNARMNYFLIRANETREISITGAQFGEAGVVTEAWGEDGYTQKGINTNSIKEIMFYFPEPDTKQMAGQTSLSYIIDNIAVKTAAEASVISGPCVISQVVPSPNATSSAGLKVIRASYNSLNNRLVHSSNGGVPGNMNIIFSKNGQNVFAGANGKIQDIKPGDKVSMNLQMYDVYFIKDGEGTTNLEVSLSSHKPIEILTPVLSWKFTDENPVGEKGKSLNFEFIMPNGTIDALLDFDWSFNLK